MALDVLKPDLHLKMLFQELRLWCRAIQNANLLQKVHTVRNQSSKARLIWIWPPASLHNLKETPTLPKRKALLMRKTMTPLVCFANPILQLHPSITNIRHSLWGLGRILVVRSCISGQCGHAFWGAWRTKRNTFPEDFVDTKSRSDSQRLTVISFHAPLFDV